MKKYITILFAMLVIAGCANENKESSNKTEVDSSILQLTDAQLKNIDIDTVTFRTENLPITIRLNAKTQVSPHNTVSITNPFGGYVKRVNLIPGNYVQKGQVVIVLEDPQYIQMQEDYLTTKVLLEQAKADYNRQRELNKQQAASDKVAQQANATQKTLEIKKRSLEEKLKLINIIPSRVSLTHIQRTVNVYAPISGRISEVNVNTGQYVSPADEMVEIINANSALLTVKVFEKDLLNIKVGQPLKAFTNARPEQMLDAEITSIANKVNSDGTVEVFAKITNSSGINLTENMYFNVELETSRLFTYILPKEAVVQYEGQQYIIERLNRNKFKLIPVKTGMSSRNKVEVTSPQSNGKVYVSNGAFNLLTAFKNGGEE